jgi:hypothetical protein
MDVALLLVHVSVDDWPAVIDVGAAEKVAVGGGEPPTVIVTCPVRGVPSAVPFTVSVYVVVAAGVTLIELFDGRDPSPLSIVTLVPPLLQVNVDDPPGEMVSGDPANEKRHP